MSCWLEKYLWRPVRILSGLVIWGVAETFALKSARRKIARLNPGQDGAY